MFLTAESGCSGDARLRGGGWAPAGHTLSCALRQEERLTCWDDVLYLGAPSRDVGNAHCCVWMLVSTEVTHFKYFYLGSCPFWAQGKSQIFVEEMPARNSPVTHSMNDVLKAWDFMLYTYCGILEKDRAVMKTWTNKNV